MGSVKVTVYGRVKPSPKNIRSQEYQLKVGEHYDQITFANKISSGKKTYRFSKIFGENASQEDVFETVAKPIIKRQVKVAEKETFPTGITELFQCCSVLTGYNGTIFTYGQTGSGKTYTMTGDIEQWINPGLIPRTVQEIFRQKSRDTPISITYCEIYNEHVYDLIRVDRLDPNLQQVNIIEDSGGITHFRNLSVHLVKSVFEALQLLIRGDANKMVAETNSNARSSRSHVIFSIGLELPHPTEEKLCLKPVLYLVDLAGSEKLSKCKTSVSNPLETRYINLSLHYLEQVLIALRQPGRNHIPYRNSLMTALLRNSLGGNCITAMIATFSLALDDLEETMQTCRFAERIALIKNDVKLSELLDPQKEILLLKRENDKLKAQLRLVNVPQCKHQKGVHNKSTAESMTAILIKCFCGLQVPEELTEKDRVKCSEMVQNFIRGNDIFDLPLSDLRRMEYCFRIMREEILKNEAKDRALKKADATEDVLELLKINSSKGGNVSLKNSITEERKSKVSESNAGRKRTPMDLPKINVTYKRWKSTDQISDNENPTVRKLSSRDFSSKEFSSRDLSLVTSNLSESTLPSYGLLSDTSLKKLSTKAQERAKENPDDASVADGCLINGGAMTGSKNDLLSKEKNMSLLSAEVSGLLVKDEVPSQSEVPLETKITCNDIRHLISVGIQVEDNTSVDSQSAYGLSLSSTVETSVHSMDVRNFSDKSLPLTGDNEVDEEILKFYKARYQSLQKNQ